MCRQHSGTPRDRGRIQKKDSGEIQKQKRLGISSKPFLRAQDKTRTCTNVIVHYPLKVACLPISPPGLFMPFGFRVCKCNSYILIHQIFRAIFSVFLQITSKFPIRSLFHPLKSPVRPSARCPPPPRESPHKQTPHPRTPHLLQSNSVPSPRPAPKAPTEDSPTAHLRLHPFHKKNRPGDTSCHPAGPYFKIGKNRQAYLNSISSIR